MKREHDNFEYYNPNPLYKPMKNGKNKHWYKEDYPVRALCCATNCTWVNAYKTLFNNSLDAWDMPNTVDGFNKTMEKMNFVFKQYGKPNKGDKRITLSEFAKASSGNICIANIANRFVCCKEGKYFDTEDCGDNVVYSYWINL